MPLKPLPLFDTLSVPNLACQHSSRNGNLNLDPSLNVDDDLLDHLRRRIQIDQSLVDPHLVHVPGLAALAAGRLARRHLEGLGRQPHGTLDPEVLGLGPLQELRAHLLQRLHLARREGDADLVDFLDRQKGS
jgi:hypothetical protein